MAPGLAFSYPFGIISIINRIVVSPCGFWFGARLLDDLDRLSLGFIYTSNEGRQDRQEQQLFPGSIFGGGTEKTTGGRRRRPKRAIGPRSPSRQRRGGWSTGLRVHPASRTE